MKVDLHVHSKFSRRPSEWILKKLDCPESFTEPIRLYKVAKDRGMSLVTITDHNTIEGCLQIAHLPATFISEEVTTYFPQDGCKLHVLVYNINEAIHEDIQHLRDNVFDLATYLRQNRITHVLAHPLFSVNRKLTVEHVEQTLIFFKNFELNGARSEQQNRCLQLLLSLLTPEIMERISETYNLSAPFTFPWIKNLSAGSDDHSSLTIAGSYTEVEGTHNVEEFLEGLEAGRATVPGSSSTPKSLARNVYAIAYQFYQHKFGLDRYTDSQVILTFLHRFLVVDQDREPGLLARLSSYLNPMKPRETNNAGSTSVVSLLQQETNKLIYDDPELADIFKNGNGKGRDLDEQWFEFVNKVSNRVLSHLTDHVIDSLHGGHLFNLFHTLGSAGALYSLLSPYFVSFSIFSDDRKFGERALKRFLSSDQMGSRPRQEINVAHFTDTLYEINGVANTLKQQIMAAGRLKKRYTVITCDSGDRGHNERIRNFKPIGVYELSVYPEQKLFYPPFLEILDYCYEAGFSHIHSATPGPLGLAALAIARILGIPLVGTYHTAVPQYALYLTEDQSLSDLIWKYILWYYDQMSLVLVPSHSTASELAEKGIAREKIRVFPRGVDTNLFHPARRNGSLDAICKAPNALKMLYVGRISREKNLEVLARVFRSLIESGKNVSLIVVGDGPYREQMEQTLRDTPSVFTGYVQGEALASIYASSDLFVFPSTTDTFGNVILEAQASGLPVVVTDCGGPQENMIHGETGIVVAGKNEVALLEAIAVLLDDPDRLKRMGRTARELVERRTFDGAFEQTWQLYADVSEHEKPR